MLMLNNKPIVRLTQSAQQQVEQGESSQRDETREGSVRPGHDGETHCEFFLFSLDTYLNNQ